jgi:predicted DNA-binding protein (MmcQ/YjbR family)
MFAIIAEGKSPARISLKCDPQLAGHLRKKYNEVQPGYHLNKQHWNTIIMSGELSNSEVFDLIDHSYDLVVAGMPQASQKKLRKN